MSGHSHAKTIKHQKDLTDKKRGQVFSKLAKLIFIAVKEKGPNPETNYSLRMAMEAAKAANMPKDNVDRAVKRGTGELEGEKLEEVIFEAYGPGGVAIIVEGITDNTNRALGEVKQALNQFGGKLAGEGSVRWMFERKGCLTINFQFLISNSQIKNKEELEMAAIEAGAQDWKWLEDMLEVHTGVEELEEVKKKMEEKGIKIESYSLDWVPKDEVSADEQAKNQCQKLFDALDELESVQEIYSNIKLL